MSKIVCLADQHGYLPEIPQCDILLIAGDICPLNDHGIRYQKTWLNFLFRDWLKSVPASHIVGVAGNHDYVFEKNAHKDLNLPWDYLHKQDVKINDLKIWGSPYQLHFFDWAFNAPENDGESYLANIYADIPEDTDIIISHGPPKGYGDLTSRGEHVGSEALLKRIKEVKPKYVITGHIHFGRGIFEIDHGQSITKVINASVLTEKYKPVDGKLFEFDL